MCCAEQADADEMLQKAAESGNPEELQRAIKAVEQIHKAQEQYHGRSFLEGVVRPYGQP